MVAGTLTKLLRDWTSGLSEKCSQRFLQSTGGTQRLDPPSWASNLCTSSSRDISALGRGLLKNISSSNLASVSVEVTRSIGSLILR